MSTTTPNLDDSFRVLHERAHEFVSDKQEELEAEYEFGQHDGYHVDWETSSITFLHAETPIITFPFQIIGKLMEKNKWTWRWHEADVTAAEREELDIIRNYGDFYDFGYLTAPEMEASTPLAWALTAISAYLRGAKGVFRIQTDQSDLFVCLQLPEKH